MRFSYEVHEKLQNFMVHVPVQVGGWHEEQIDELFSSLLGKGFEGVEEVDAQPEANAIQADVPLSGLRVFG